MYESLKILLFCSNTCIRLWEKEMGRDGAANGTALALLALVKLPSSFGLARKHHFPTIYRPSPKE